ELADGLRRRIVVLGPGELHDVRVDRRLAPRDPAQEVAAAPERAPDRARDREPRRPAAEDGPDLLEDRAVREVLVPEDVALARAPALERADRAGDDVPRVDEVVAAVARIAE